MSVDASALQVVHSEAVRVAETARSPDLAQFVMQTTPRVPLGATEVGVAVTAAEHGGVLFLLLASTSEALADIDELARAFVWPSYARARRSTAHLSAETPLGAAVDAIAPAGAVALLASTEGHRASLSAIKLMLEVRANRPDGTVAAPRQIGRILRDFEDAVAREDPSSASRFLAEAEATGRLNLTNVGLLQLRILVTSRRWKDALDHTERHRLVVQELPRAVEHDIVRAAYHHLLETPLSAGGLDAAIAAFRDEVAPRLSDVFRDPRCAATPEARSAWMLRYAASDREWPDAARAEIIEAAQPAELEWLEAIASRCRFVANSRDGLARTLLSAREHAAAFSAGEADTTMPLNDRAAVLAQAAVPLKDPLRLAVASRAISAAGSAAVDAPSAVVDLVGRTDVPTVAVHDWPTWLRVSATTSPPGAMRLRRSTLELNSGRSRCKLSNSRRLISRISSRLWRARNPSV